MRYQKDHKLTLWAEESEQDECGAMHARYRLLGTYWAHYRPVSVTSKYATAASLEIADCVFTVNKPSWFLDGNLTEIYTVWQGRVLKVTRVEDIDGMTRGDVRLYMRQEPHKTPESFSDKVIND